MSFETAAQTAIAAELSGDAALNAAVTGIFDHVPQDQSFPYVTVGEADFSEWDTVSDQGMDCTITIHSWSRIKGKKEIRTIQGLIYNVMHKANLSHTGFNFVLCNFQNSQNFTDADGFTQHGVQTFRLVIERA